MDYKGKYSDVISLLCSLIATPSLSRNEGAASNLIEEFLLEKGYSVNRCGNNVWVKSHSWDDSLPVVLLDAHVDTVAPQNGWTHEPFSASIEGERIYGLGANDDGGSLVSLLQTFILWDENGGNGKFNIIFSASAEEEVSGKNGIEESLKTMPEISFGLIGEPTGMEAAVAEKGLMVIDVTETGVSGHAARNEGVNALYKAVDDINWVRNHQFARVSPLLGEVKATVTIINAGSTHNVIPAQCQFTIDVRSNECYSNEELFAEIQNGIQGKAKARSYRLNSSHADLNHPLLLRISELGIPQFGSPTLSNQALMQFPTVKIGPGQSSRSHSADEYICISEIEEAVEIYSKILQ